jgi:glycosyltransferase involved in cell wall biosynthesis
MKLTIITVVKNDKKNLQISIKSILSQTYKNFEYIIYDGMSSDGTKSVVKKYLNKNIKYICREDKSYYEGLNYAISKASGNYIGILNAGDQYYNVNILKKITKIICLRNYDFLFGNLIYIDSSNRYVRCWKFPVKKLTVLSALKIASPTIFIKKKLARSYPYNCKYKISSDIDFNLRLSKKNFKFLYLNQYIIFMRTGGLSTSYKFFLQRIVEDLCILKKYFKNTFVLIYLYKIIIKIRTFSINPQCK